MEAAAQKIVQAAGDPRRESGGSSASLVGTSSRPIAVRPSALWRAAQRLALCVGGLTLSAGLSAAQPRSAQGEHLSAQALAQQLRRIQFELDSLSAPLAFDQAAAGTALLSLLSEAQNDYLRGQPQAAALKLIDLLSYPQVKTSPSYPEALRWLGRSLSAIGHTHAAQRAFEEAIHSQAQTPSDYLTGLALWLDHTPKPDLEALTRHAWYAQQLQERDGLPFFYGDISLDYRIARAYDRVQATAQARAAFAQLAVDDPRYLHGQYFLAVMWLREGELVRARELFEQTLDLWYSSGPEKPPLTESETPPALLEALDVENREPVLIPVDARIAAPEYEPQRHQAHQDYLRLGHVLHLALARMAADAEDYETAWAYYRLLPAGDPDQEEALWEASFVLAQREQFDWSARVAEQLLEARGSDAEAAQKQLWIAELHAKGADYEGAQRRYEALEAKLLVAKEALERSDDPAGLFSAGTLAWGAPQAAQAALRGQRELYAQQAVLQEAQATLEALDHYLRTSQPLARVERTQSELAQLQERLDRLSESLGRAVERRSPGEPSWDQLRTSAAQLRFRLQHFEGQLGVYVRNWRARVEGLVVEERAQLQALRGRLGGQMQEAQGLAREVRGQAQREIERLTARARFGVVDLSWWRAEETRRKKAQLFAEQEQQILELEVDGAMPLSVAPLRAALGGRGAPEEEPTLGDPQGAQLLEEADLWAPPMDSSPLEVEKPADLERAFEGLDLPERAPRKERRERPSRPQAPPERDGLQPERSPLSPNGAEWAKPQATR